MGVVSVGEDMEMMWGCRWAPALDGIRVGGLGKVLERICGGRMRGGVGSCGLLGGGFLQGLGEGRDPRVCGLRSGGGNETFR